MAPSAVETPTTVHQEVANKPLPFKVHLTPYKEIDTTRIDRDVEEGRTGQQGAKYPNYLPTWNPDQKYPPLTPFEHYEHGKDADTTFPNLLPKDTAIVSHLTPTIGTEVKGIQLSSLNAAGKDELARFVAERKVVAFRGQDFADLPIADALEYGGYFGRHHIHPTSGSPEGYPEVHLVHRGAGDQGWKSFFEARTSSVAWHSDVSYEAQPPGTTFLYILDGPDVGGDTLFVDAVQAYKRLSPLFQERLHGLKATHSGVEQVNAAVARGSIKRRDPVINEHPIVRTHPATGEKALYVNPQFTREIVGLKKEESDAILKFLYDHLAYGADFQTRVRWEAGTVVLWDNRVTQHSALVDWESGQRRHLARITPQAERPYETPFAG
jgi:sulfonate dioxygenase